MRGRARATRGARAARALRAAPLLEMMAVLLLVVLLFPQPKLGAAAARGCPHNVALQGGLAGTSMVLDRGGSRLFGVTPFPNDTITVTLNSQPAVHMTLTAGRRLPHAGHDKRTAQIHWRARRGRVVV